MQCILLAMSVLAFLGLRYPVKMLPILLFESMWKLTWLAVIALPQLSRRRPGRPHHGGVHQHPVRRPHPGGHPMGLRRAAVPGRARRSLALHIRGAHGSIDLTSRRRPVTPLRAFQRRAIPGFMRCALSS